MNEMRKLMETIETINEVSDYDGEELNALIIQFIKTYTALGLENDLRKQKELLDIVMAKGGYDRYEQRKTREGPGGIGHDNALGNDHEPHYGGGPFSRQ